MTTFKMKCGGSVAHAAGISGAPDHESASGQYCHWVRNVPYRFDSLTPAARKLVSCDLTARNIFVRDNDAPAHPQFGTAPKYACAQMPPADEEFDMIDCTDWLNRTAARSGYYADARK